MTEQNHGTGLWDALSDILAAEAGASSEKPVSSAPAAADAFDPKPRLQAREISQARATNRPLFGGNVQALNNPPWGLGSTLDYVPYD